MKRLMLCMALIWAPMGVCADDWTVEERELFKRSTQIAVADVLQTYQFTKSGVLREVNPLLAERPSTESLIVSTIGGQAAVYGIADAIPQRFRKRALQAYTAIRYGVIVSNDTLMYNTQYLQGEDRVNEPDFAIGFKIRF